MKPIRVLHMSGTMNMGGAETLIMELYRHIDRDKIQFDFMIYNYSHEQGAYDDEILNLGGHIYNMNGRFSKNPIYYLIELKRFFDNHKEYRIVHAHQFAISGYVLAMAKLSNPGIFTIAHSHIAYPQTDFLRNIADIIGKKLLVYNADTVFGCSNDALIALTGKEEDGIKYRIVRNAIDIKKFIYNEKKRDIWRKILGVKEDTFVVGNVARFTNQKNHEFIVSIFSSIKRTNKNSKLVLIGTGSKIPEIQRLVKELNLEEDVILLGVRPDVNEIINAFDVFLMPSRYEGLGIVLIEAQANGLPCIISKDVIPEEVDTRGGMIKRVSLNELPDQWASECISAGKRKATAFAQQAVKSAGYDINKVALDLQNFYLDKWST